MLRSSGQHLLSRWQQLQQQQIAANKRWFASTIGRASSSSSSSASSARGRRMAAYVTACTTAGAFTCYRPDELIDYDPYNASSSILAVVAHRFVNGPGGLATFNILTLLGCLVVGEFLGNGFRHTRRQFFGVSLTDQERHQLLDEVAKIADLDHATHAMEKDLLDSTFENAISNILIQAKTRWVHLSDRVDAAKNDNSSGTSGTNSDNDNKTRAPGVTLLQRKSTSTIRSVPDHMSTDDLQMAIHKMSIKAGDKEQDTYDEKEALLQVLSVADINNDGKITFHEFTRALLLLEFAKRDNFPNAKAELYFRAIDLHNNGSISQEELLHFAKRLYVLGGIPINDRTASHWSGLYERLATPEEICANWMDRFDLNHDGLISREEFYKMAKEIDFGPSFLFTKYFERTTTE
ncbi:unnamed protein product [Cylindrotheca closterium]|uniref:EF-hand domain-containing protein n=1 Tax=Cylindrotheca closterium TaxID=2856 RepID=A0AAD2FCN5_9STRA|nr:unnamed protein product [Cylindrotheca closterium]